MSDVKTKVNERCPTYLYLQAFFGSRRDSVVLFVVLLQEATPLDVLRLGDVGLELGQLRKLELLRHLFFFDEGRAVDTSQHQHYPQLFFVTKAGPVTRVNINTNTNNQHQHRHERKNLAHADGRLSARCCVQSDSFGARHGKRHRMSSSAAGRQDNKRQQLKEQRTIGGGTRQRLTFHSGMTWTDAWRSVRWRSLRYGPRPLANR